MQAYCCKRYDIQWADAEKERANYASAAKAAAKADQ